jgi:hypothetical protein
LGRGAEGRACEEFPEIGLAPARAAAVRGVRGVAGAAALLRVVLEEAREEEDEPEGGEPAGVGVVEPAC